MNPTQALAAAILSNIGPDPYAPQHLATLRRAIGQHCAIQGCDNDHRSNGLCDSHLRQHNYAMRNQSFGKQVLTQQEIARIREERVEDVEHLLESGQTPERVTELMGTTLGALRNLLYRANRPDLARPFAAIERRARRAAA